MPTPIWSNVMSPTGWGGVTISTNNPKVDGRYYDIISSDYVSLAASGKMHLVSNSGIELITPGYVTASGMIVQKLFTQQLNKIDAAGNTLSQYPGTTGSLVFKVDDQTVNTNSTFIVNTGINKLTMPNVTVNRALFVSDGGSTANPTRELAIFSPVEYIPQKTVEGSIIPAEVNITGANLTVSNIQIGEDISSYKDTILTHQGSGPAAWMPAVYLKAEGVKWNRYPKRAISIFEDRIIFYTSKPTWALLGSADDYAGFSLDTLDKEFSLGDTIAIIKADTLAVTYVKAAVTVTFPADEPDPSTSFASIFESTNAFTDANGDSNPGYVMLICPDIGTSTIPAGVTCVNGYAFSVKKGGYLSMQLEPDATSKWGCGPGPFNNADANTFKPNTLNHISTRPNTSTSFNMLAENIDFSIYGYRSTTRGNYDANLFSLDSSGNNIGLIPAFLIDSNINNAVSGSMTGVILTGYSDREKLEPVGYHVDESPKVCINTRTPYVMASINNITSDKFLSSYSSLTVNGSTYTDSLITKELYVTPKPGITISSEYVVNALLTINSAGKIVSRKPTINPTAPPSPTNVSSLVSGHDEFSISWTQSSDGGKKIINYIIEFSTNSGNTWTTVSTDKILRGMSSQTSCTIIGQEPTINYLFRVSAQNAIGISNPSEPSISMTSDQSLPECPKDISQTRIFGESTSDIALSWTAPTSAGSSAVSGYIIEESENDGISWVNYNISSSLIINTYETIYGLSNNIDYLYRVSAINDSGESAYAFVRSGGNSLLEEEVDEAIKDVLSNWDFGSILFTGVCTV
jgi:Fibronectin type III domain